MANPARLLGLTIVPLWFICSSAANDQPFDTEVVGRVDLNMTTVLVAKRNLALGTVVKNPGKYFEEKEIPAYAAPTKCRIRLRVSLLSQTQ